MFRDRFRLLFVAFVLSATPSTLATESTPDAMPVARIELTGPAADPAAVPASCAAALASVPTHRVAIVWYPASQYFIATHAELDADGTVWKTNPTYRERASREGEERAVRRGGYGFVRFWLRMTDAELAAMKKDLATPRSPLSLLDQSCMSAAVGAVARATPGRWSRFIPFASRFRIVPEPLRRFPTVAALYLTLRSAFPGSRVEGIELVGKPRMFLSPAMWAELAFVTYCIGIPTARILYQLVTGSP